MAGCHLAAPVRVAETCPKALDLDGYLDRLLPLAEERTELRLAALERTPEARLALGLVALALIVQLPFD